MHAGPGMQALHGSEHVHNVSANALVAYLEDGIEVLHLFSGGCWGVCACVGMGPLLAEPGGSIGARRLGRPQRMPCRARRKWAGRDGVAVWRSERPISPLGEAGATSHVPANRCQLPVTRRLSNSPVHNALLSKPYLPVPTSHPFPWPADLRTSRPHRVQAAPASPHAAR